MADDRTVPATRLTVIPNIVIHVGDYIVPDVSERGDIVEFRLFDQRQRHYATIVGRDDPLNTAALVTEIQWLEASHPPVAPAAETDPEWPDGAEAGGRG
jgi:hypothetical protein